MRVKTLEIRWHNSESNGSEPIYACDFQPLHLTQLKKLVSARQSSSDARTAAQSCVGQSFRLVTGGGDNNVRVWMVHPNYLPAAAVTSVSNEPPPTPHPPRVEYLATLSRHSAAVNVVRFSPNGDFIASAGDDGSIIIWAPSDRPMHQFGSEVTDEYEKEHWRVKTSIHCSQREVYDLAWSPNGEWLIAGSTDNTARIFNAATGACVKESIEHTHYVQGVAWDPLNEYFATQSSDRSVNVHSVAIGRAPNSDMQTFESHIIGRNTRMAVKHSRTSSIPREGESSMRPALHRRTSTVSDAGSMNTAISDLLEDPSSGLPRSNRPSFHGPPTPVTSVPSTPSVLYPLLDAPHSRRSSFNGSNAASPPARSHSHSRYGRSPSPMPPLPAIRQSSSGPSWAQIKLYGDESYTNFFRRLTFSPDGALLLTPAGQFDDSAATQRDVSRRLSSAKPPSHEPSTKPKAGTATEGPKSSVYIYSRASFARPPVAHLPGHKTASVAVKFSPMLYELRPDVAGSSQAEVKKFSLQRGEAQIVDVDMGIMPERPAWESTSEAPAQEKEHTPSTSSVFALPYRMMFAVATQDNVLLYDTQQAGPICMFANLHYASFTDLAWSPDGQSLMLASSDGYCSLVVFDDPIPLYHSQQHHRQMLSIAQSHSASSFHQAQPISLPFPPPPPPPVSSTASMTSTVPAKRAQPPTPAESLDGTIVGVGPSAQPAEEQDDTAQLPAKKKRRVELKHLGGLDAV